MIDAYPLAWPEGWPRTPPARRTRAKFGKGSFQAHTGGGGYMRKRELTVTDGTQRILGELQRMGISDRQDVVISSNVRLRLDGLPRSGEREPDDPGVAVYWADKAGGAPKCMAIDIYDRVADNLGAVAATIEAMRAIERHGGAEILGRAFKGFTALPAPGDVTARGWREVLGFPADRTPQLSEVESNYKTLRSKHHPDKGGDGQQFMLVQAAYEQAQQELGQ